MTDQSKESDEKREYVCPRCKTHVAISSVSENSPSCPKCKQWKFTPYDIRHKTPMTARQQTPV